MKGNSMTVVVPTTFSLVMAGGVDWQIGFTLFQIVDGVKEPIDLTGYTAKLQMRLAYDSPDAVLTLTDGAGITLGGAAGTVLVHATYEQVNAIPAETYEIGLQIMSSGEVKYSLLEQQIDKLETAVQ